LSFIQVEKFPFPVFFIFFPQTLISVFICYNIKRN
jgi:hypothetical protein